MDTTTEHGGGEEVIAWDYWLANAVDSEGGYTNWTSHISRKRPNVPEGSIRNLRPLYAAQPAAPDPSAEKRKTWAPLPDPSHMEWKALHDELHARVVLESVGDEDLCASREEVCALLSWARSFDREAQPRRDEEERAYSIISRAANRIESSNAPDPSASASAASPVWVAIGYLEAMQQPVEQEIARHLRSYLAAPDPSADGGGGRERLLALSAADYAFDMWRIQHSEGMAMRDAFRAAWFAALASRTPALGAAGVAKAFDVGFEWAAHLFGSPQNLEDSRGVARTLCSDLFDGLGVSPDAVTPSRMAEEGIVQAKAEIKRALLAAARGTRA